MPLGKMPGRNIATLTREHAGDPDWPRKRIIAAGLNAAREKGSHVPTPKGKHMMPGGHMMADKDMPKKKRMLKYLGKGKK